MRCIAGTLSQVDLNVTRRHVSSTVKVDGDSVFQQALATSGAWALTSFQLGGEYYLAMARPGFSGTWFKFRFSDICLSAATGIETDY